MNRRIVELQKKNESNGSQERKKSESRKNKGKLILDATCTPADIKYPTDLGLLNEARKHTERVIDQLYKTQQGRDYQLLFVVQEIYRQQLWMFD